MNSGHGNQGRGTSGDHCGIIPTNLPLEPILDRLDRKDFTLAKVFLDRVAHAEFSDV